MWAHLAAGVHRHHPMGTAVVVAAGPCFSLVWNRSVFQEKQAWGKQGWGAGDTHDWHPRYLDEGTDSPGVAGQWAAAGHRDLWPQDQDLWAPGSALMLLPGVPDFLEGLNEIHQKGECWFLAVWCSTWRQSRRWQQEPLHLRRRALPGGVTEETAQVTLSKRLNKHLWWMKYELQTRSV